MRKLYIYKKITHSMDHTSGNSFFLLFAYFLYNLALWLSSMATWEKMLNFAIAGIGAFSLGALTELGKRFINKDGTSKMINNIKNFFRDEDKRA